MSDKSNDKEKVGALNNNLTPSPANPLYQLPSSPADFTGREAEIDELLAKIPQGGVTIYGIKGMGGIGKTALALVLAKTLTPLYPDAQIFLDLRSTDPTPLSWTQAMSHVIRTFYSDIKLPESDAELTALYHSVLAGKRVLLLLDNAIQTEQVEPLRPPAGSAMIVTSRQQFYLSGFYTKDLDALPLDDACQLLRRIAPRIGEQDVCIAQLCSNLPLALQIAAKTLHKSSTLSLSDYIKRLEQ
ncbi:MAG: NB-ARC domain-containing protein, partial [Acidobacteriota bacterium]